MTTPSLRTTTTGTAPAPRVGGSLVSLPYLRIEVRRLLRNRRTLSFGLIMPVFFYLVFGVTQKEDAAKAYVMISLAVYGGMTIATSTGAAVAVERASGWSRQLRLTPLRPSAYVTTKMLAALVLAALPVTVEFILGAALGARMDTHDWVIAALVAWLGSLTFAALGLALGYLLPSENALQFVGLIMVVLSFLGGLFVPLSVLGSTWRHIARFTPAYGVGTLARYPLAQEGSIVGCVVNIVVWMVIFAAAAALLFRRDTARV